MRTDMKTIREARENRIKTLREMVGVHLEGEMPCGWDHFERWLIEKGCS